MTAFLNSKLFRFCFRNNFPELLGETRELSKVFFEQIKIKQVSLEIENRFCILIEEIQGLRKQNKNIKDALAIIELEISQLYGLTNEEFTIINAID